MRTLLTIAGHDPSSGAGVTADLAVFAAHGHFGTSAITALTVQSTRGVERVQPVEAALLAQTLLCLHADLPPAGIKLGMLATEPNVAAVAAFLRGRVCPVVLDPVLRSSSGAALLSDEGTARLIAELLPSAAWITPNRDELAALTGVAPGLNDLATEAAVRALQRQVPGLGVVATGGDSAAADEFSAAADDLFAAPDGTLRWLRATRIASRATHGTGCAFASALLARLVSGAAPYDAVAGAKAWVRRAILAAPALGHGRGPMHLHLPGEMMEAG